MASRVSNSKVRWGKTWFLGWQKVQTFGYSTRTSDEWCQTSFQGLSVHIFCIKNMEKKRYKTGKKVSFSKRVHSVSGWSSKHFPRWKQRTLRKKTPRKPLWAEELCEQQRCRNAPGQAGEGVFVVAQILRNHSSKNVNPPKAGNMPRGHVLPKNLWCFCPKITLRLTNIHLMRTLTQHGDGNGADVPGANFQIRCWGSSPAHTKWGQLDYPPAKGLNGWVTQTPPKKCMDANGSRNSPGKTTLHIRRVRRHSVYLMFLMLVPGGQRWLPLEWNLTHEPFWNQKFSDLSSERAELVYDGFVRENAGNIRV